jgi:hypothetical protein
MLPDCYAELQDHPATLLVLPGATGIRCRTQQTRFDLHGVSGSDTPGSAHHENPTKARITRKDTRNA